MDHDDTAVDTMPCSGEGLIECALLGERGFRRRPVDYRDLARPPLRLLRSGDHGPGDGPSHRGQQEAATVHAAMVGQAVVCSQTSGRWGYSSPSQRCTSSAVEKNLMSSPL